MEVFDSIGHRFDVSTFANFCQFIKYADWDPLANGTRSFFRDQDGLSENTFKTTKEKFDASVSEEEPRIQRKLT